MGDFTEIQSKFNIRKAIPAIMQHYKNSQRSQIQKFSDKIEHPFLLKIFNKLKRGHTKVAHNKVPLLGQVPS